VRDFILFDDQCKCFFPRDKHLSCDDKQRIVYLRKRKAMFYILAILISWY